MIKEGRFGAYITDGEYNATVPRSESVEEITAERAFELLADKRAAGPAKKAGGRKKAAAKKTPAKKAAAKKTAATKAAAKKTAVTKTAAKKIAAKKTAAKKASE